MEQSPIQHLKERLKIQKLTAEHLTQFNELLRYVFQVTNEDLQEVGWEDEEIERSKLPVLEKANVVGWFDGDKLASQIAVYPFEVNIYGKKYKMGGVTGVGTYPEYANLGLINELMLHCLTEMCQAGQTISYLYPYSIPYYRKKGWEIISDKMNYTMKDTQLPKPTEVYGMVERVDFTYPDILHIYQQFSETRHGAMIRGEIAWEEYWRWETDETIAAIYYDPDGLPQGYVFYNISNDVFDMKEMVYLNQEARNGLWNYITAHFSMVDEVKGRTYTNEPIAFLMEDSAITETIKPYIMARIVDVKQFLIDYPFEKVQGKLHFIVKDPLLTWNRGIFSVEIAEDGQVTIGEEETAHPIEVSIQMLTTMLMGYRRPAYLHKYDKISGAKNSLELLERMLPKGSAYFSDYF
ncbi:GNAT family N-acetyltransferase [Isobaculum melis]|uniref:Predicted acetyltransferase n=1 Tax=Isobaculum melis TaxID=142588 RepID=A0A1H9RNX2_9LACT|nr:GNAT family N-acetyltransferase [Isobaculum melis]SER73579.1 Predicted acetyltransferase [Isobaculum melis]